MILVGGILNNPQSCDRMTTKADIEFMRQHLVNLRLLLIELTDLETFKTAYVQYGKDGERVNEILDNLTAQF